MNQYPFHSDSLNFSREGGVERRENGKGEIKFHLINSDNKENEEITVSLNFFGRRERRKKKSL